MNIVCASCSASPPLAAAIFALPLARLGGGDRRRQLGDELLGVGPHLGRRRLADHRLVVVKGAATELAALLRLPLLSVALTEVEKDLGQPRQRVGAFELRDRVGVFPRLYAVFPRPNAAFASSRRAAAGSGAAAAARRARAARRQRRQRPT